MSKFRPVFQDEQGDANVGGATLSQGQIEDETLPSADEIPAALPIIPLNSLVLYPFMIAPMMVNDDATKKLVEETLVGDRLVGMFTVQPDEEEEEEAANPTPLIEPADQDRAPLQTVKVRTPQHGPDTRLYRVGTATRIMKMLRIPDGTMRLLVHGVRRVSYLETVQTAPYLKAAIMVCEESSAHDSEIEAMLKSARQMLQKLVELSSLPEDVLVAATNLNDPGKLADMIASNLQLRLEERQIVLETLEAKDRLGYVLRVLGRELEVTRLGSKIQSKAQDSMNKTQRDYYLRQQMKAIQRELGEGEDVPVEIRELRERVEKAQLPEKPKQVAGRELDRLEKMHPGSAEYTVSMTYLDWILDLPWRESTRDNYDLAKAAKILDDDHYGLEKIKERILEHLAVIKLKKEIRGPILCFVGPPGVGKTSLGRSIARSLSRKFHRFSVGGMRDEAEIRGHRRTYIGALPGRILKALRDCEANNPVIMIDEIDKIGADYRGDPASALLETLDPEQNDSFTDNYLDMPFDLSKVMFITTANVLDTIPGPLLDRMEVIRLAGYTRHEKLEIAKQYLVARRMDATGVTKKHIAFEDEALMTLIDGYTREAGVRNLEREIGSVCLKVARRVAEGDTKKVVVTPEVVAEMLGPPKVVRETEIRTETPGVATGLAWTPTGGEILFIETTSTPGSGRLIQTGQLGEVMKESVQAAFSYLRRHAKDLKLPASEFGKRDFHIHVPAGAVPKDGPSAGVAICAALVSLMRNETFPDDAAMTGEITLSGKVLPIGGLKEKVIAARQARLKRVIAPSLNKKDLHDIPDQAIEGVRFVWVDTIEDAIEALFPGKRKSTRAGKTASKKRTAAKKASKKKTGKKTTSAGSVSKKKTGKKKTAAGSASKKKTGKKTTSAGNASKKKAGRKTNLAKSASKKKAPAKKRATAGKKKATESGKESTESRKSTSRSR